MHQQSKRVFAREGLCVVWGHEICPAKCARVATLNSYVSPGAVFIPRSTLYSGLYIYIQTVPQMSQRVHFSANPYTPVPHTPPQISNYKWQQLRRCWLWRISSFAQHFPVLSESTHSRGSRSSRDWSCNVWLFHVVLFTKLCRPVPWSWVWCKFVAGCCNLLASPINLICDHIVAPSSLSRSRTLAPTRVLVQPSIALRSCISVTLFSLCSFLLF